MSDRGAGSKQASDAALGPRKRTWPSRAEVFLAVIAALLLLGWILRWSKSSEFTLFSSWFAALSFFGGLAIVTYVVLKPFGVLSLPVELERRVIPVVTLIPVLGYLIEHLWPFHNFLTLGGTIALAYLSAVTYWRKQLIDFPTEKLTEEDEPKTEEKDRPQEAHDAPTSG